MHSRSVAVAVFFTVCAGGAAIACYARASSYRSQAEWLLVRGNAEASEYASSFNGALADKELATFEERRALLERSRSWQMWQMLAVLVAVIGLFSSYTLSLFSGLRHELEEVAPLGQPPARG